jgi:bis(5'-nucleosyl)-tetraphosphatase (symmetrical)
MSTYAIGDIQGCYHAFLALLEKINFDPEHDRLWLVGDLINRGNGSLEVLRWCYQHRDNLKVVLGNHDLHALVVAHEFVVAHRSDTLHALLAAPDRDELLQWLRHQHLVYCEDDILMVHAGLLPAWSKDEALRYAAEVEAALRGEQYLDFLSTMYGNYPNAWQPDLQGIDRLRLLTNAMTRLRVCNDAGEMDFAFKGELSDIPQGLIPWFDMPNRATQDITIVFGHWSALGLQQRENLYALDTGCLWGGKLTALNLQTKEITQVQSHPLDSRYPIIPA